MIKQYQLIINGQIMLLWTHSEGPYHKQTVPETSGLYFLAGSDGNNAVGPAQTELRGIWEEHVCDFLVKQLNTQYQGQETSN